MTVDKLVARAEDELGAARLLADGGFAAQAVSRAYYGAFYAAEAALLQVGETRSKPSGVVAAFVRFVVRPGGMDVNSGRLLRSLFDRRAQADYSEDAVPAEEADGAIRDAQIVINAVVAWLEDRV
ncbi:MAG: hypothetical protein NVS3B12_29970 [Acidimicrobiales bacterium]